MTVSTAHDDRGYHELGKRLIDYNSQHIGPMEITPLLVSFRGDDGAMKGGLAGKIFYRWLTIDLLWVEESLRGKGHGRALLETAENEARTRGCTDAWLDTIGNEALGFYKRRGYAPWGELPDYPPGFRRTFFRKAL